VGRTPWSARVPLDPPVAKPSEPTRASAADLGVRPTFLARSPLLVNGSVECLRCVNAPQIERERYGTVVGHGWDNNVELI
jgi:hypothetical protein